MRRESVEDSEFTRASREIRDRLRMHGVLLTGRETGDELVRLLEAVESFEVVVERQAGDLMVDEPVGGGVPSEPDAPEFALPVRTRTESVPTFLARIAEARRRAGRVSRLVDQTSPQSRGGAV